MNSRELALEQLRDLVRECSACGLKRECRQAVFGEGNPQARIMLIGEGPGEEEDKLGRPFVGKAGQLLDKILAACGFERFTHVYIANIVKCRPPRNRIPTPEERASCLVHLHDQIKIIRPAIIVLLGSTALQGMLDPQGKITKVRGNWFEWNQTDVIPTYHPAALLRNPQLKKPVWDDFRKVVTRYREKADASHHSDYC